ncbi:MAG: hypothetical protein QOJ12_2041 [Thermoleophilales bacterium]|nr:hypothetical protein [Thermoleophilales bacterium]
MPRRTVLLVAVFGTALAAPSSAEAAKKSCRAPAGSKVVAQSPTALVYATGKQFNRYVTACTFKGRKSFRLPGQDGENVIRLFNFRLNGRYLAYSQFTAEEASPIAYSYVFSIDLAKRRKVLEVYAGDDAKRDETTTDVKALVVGKKGAVAWITESINLDVKLSVYTMAPGGKQMLLDNANDIGSNSLALAGNNMTFYWTRAGQPKGSELG